MFVFLIDCGNKHANRSRCQSGVRDHALPANPVAAGDACVLDVRRRANPQPYGLVIVFVNLPAKQADIGCMS